jgi:hypothetical protein
MNNFSSVIARKRKNFPLDMVSPKTLLPWWNTLATEALTAFAILSPKAASKTLARTPVIGRVAVPAQQQTGSA